MDIQQTIQEAEGIITIGVYASHGSQALKKALHEAIDAGRIVVCLHPIEDSSIAPLAKMFVKYEAQSEEGVLALLARLFAHKENMSDEQKQFLSSMDEGYISSECSFDEEEQETLLRLFTPMIHKLLLIGDDVLMHPRFSNIAALCQLIEQTSDFRVAYASETLSTEIHADKKSVPQDIAPIAEMNGTVIYVCESPEFALRGSRAFAAAAHVQQNCAVHVQYDNTRFETVFVIDETMKGTIAIAGVNNKLPIGYQFKQAKITLQGS